MPTSSLKQEAPAATMHNAQSPLSVGVLSAQAISAQAFVNEPDVMAALLARLAHLEGFENAIMAKATALSETLRAEGAGTGVEAFLHEYGLDTHEGIAVMCLAEALLRIPDAETANRLIRDKFEGTEWEKHLGKSDSLFVNASSWGLLLTGKVMNLGQMEGSRPAAVLGGLVRKAGEPVIRQALKQAMQFIGGQFVLGETIQDALKNAQTPARKGYRFSYDILGEGARSDAQATHYVHSYEEAIALIGEAAKGEALYAAPSISVKLSALHPRYHYSQEDRVMQELMPRLKNIVRRAKEANITVAIDAEEATRLDIEMILFQALIADSEFQGFHGIGFVAQAYQKRALPLIEWLAALAAQYGKRIPLRLVKGAYWDSEIKWAQAGGLSGYPVFTRKEHTDVSYLACADAMLSHKGRFYPQFATHNARTVASILTLARHHGVPSGEFEFQRLHGMGEKLHDQILPDVKSRIYAPVGRHKDLLAYLIRRLLENGANTSFVNLLMDKDTPLSELLADPVKQAQRSKGAMNPLIPLPQELYGAARRNSRGFDLGNLAERTALAEALSAYEQTRWNATPLLAIKTANTPVTPQTVYEPADTSKPVGTVRDVTKEEVEAALQAARNATASWQRTPVEIRASMLEKAADLLEKNAAELIALCSREAGKTIADGIAEVREAADFCRYYARQAHEIFQKTPLPGPTGESNTLQLAPRGVFLCISPWNFPLAIFTGQVTAALATGNGVIAKPSEQTRLIAARAVQLLHEAGIPTDVLQLAPGPGRVIGEALVANTGIDGVAFTGSVETAWRINRTLAARNGPIVPLIAETGGQNVMVVDSSALLEQAVDDIILSAFGSAGQRCSALRVLYVQEDIADELLHLLAGAMQELRLGTPADFATDIGPVIDDEARAMLLEHIAQMKQSAKFIASAPLPDALAAKGRFIAPHVFEIPSIATLTREIFGPVLHVVRFKASEMEKVAHDINKTGFGLTFGIHSRIEDNVQFFTSRIHAGNHYVNRSMIGAVVGVQPFGGEGLSGTGPKAGGPHYLPRFCVERTLTVNTAAIGGNLALLSGKNTS